MTALDSSAISKNGMENVSDLYDLSVVLEDLGYSVNRNGEFITSKMSIDGKDYPIVFSMASDNFGETLSIDCQVAKLKDVIPSDSNDLVKSLQLSLSLATLNYQICPFAVAIRDGADGIDEDDPIVLINSLPIGDLSVQEIEYSMDALRRALAQFISQFF